MNTRLKSLKDMYDLGEELVEIEISKLKHFKNHPFRLYDGERLEQMIRSIQELGILTPVIVREKESEYEILSGHNRVNAAKKAGLKTVPAVVRLGLSDEEAMWIVTETNLMQRSITDMTYSERALALHEHYKALSSQGKRTDLINKLQEATSCQDGEKWSSSQVVGKEFDLSPRTVSRYLMIHQLIDGLKVRLDEGNLPFMAAIELSYLSSQQQDIVEKVLCMCGGKINIKQASEVRKCKENKSFDESLIYTIVTRNGYNQEKVKRISINKRLIDEFFDEGTEQKEIEQIILKALRKYFEQ